MLELFQIAFETDTSCGGILPIVRFIRQGIMPIIQFGIPILLILFGSLDLGKAVIASEAKEVKAAQGRLIKRFIYAALIFFVPMLVGVVMNVVSAGGEGDTTSWEGCWQAAK